MKPSAPYFGLDHNPCVGSSNLSSATIFPYILQLVRCLCLMAGISDFILNDWYKAIQDKFRLCINGDEPHVIKKGLAPKTPQRH